jgi:hypothetical protein
MRNQERPDTMINRHQLKCALGLLALAAAFLHVPSVSVASTGTPPESTATANAALRQERRSMTLHLDGAAADVFPLFGPVREAEWAPTWSPHFVSPSVPMQGPEGAVFVTSSKWGDAVWVMTRYDSTRGEIAYVMFRPNVVTCELSIRVTPSGADKSDADVSYRYTALAEGGNRFIEEWAEHFSDQAPHWESGINGRLAALKSSR